MKKTNLLIVVLSVVMMISCKNTTKSNEEIVKPANKFDNQGKVIQISKMDFTDLIMDYEKNPQNWVFKGEKPCVVDFYADWCRPCVALSPIMEDLAEKYKGKLIIYKVNVDKAKNLATVFNIQSIPTLMFFKQNTQPGQIVGAPQKSQLDRKIQEFIK